MRKHHGQESRIYISAYAGGPILMICAEAEYTLSNEADQAETTSACDTNKTYVRGKPDTSGTVSGFWDSESDVVFDAAEQPYVTMYVYPSILVPGTWFGGPTIIRGWELSGSQTAPVALDWNYSAYGSWVRASAVAP